MIGLVIALLLALAVLLALWRLGRVGKAGLQLLGAALFLALAGYAWQGRPGLGGQAPAAIAPPQADGTEYTRVREAMLGRFDSASRWLIIAEGYQRRGNSGDAVGIIRAGLRQNPRDSDLWTGLGTALVAHADGLLTPASELAFARAAQLAPDHPGPLFYYGLALAQNGRFAEAEAIWREILAAAPPEAEYRQVVAERIELLARLRQAMESQAAQPPAQ